MTDPRDASAGASDAPAPPPPPPPPSQESPARESPERPLRAAQTSPAAAAPPPAAGALAAEARAATKEYGRGTTRVTALDQVTIGFAEGQFTAVMGPSGSGKSTLMHCMAGLDTLTSGQILLGDTDLSQLSEVKLTRLRRDRLGFVFQAFNLVPTLTARENIVLPLTLAGRKPDPAVFDSVIATVDLADRLKHRPSELSGGQQQRVAVARALVSQPSLIFADEPTGNLDSRAGGDILTFLRTAVSDLGQTIVMVTHDPNAASYADRVVFLADGRLVGDLTDPSADRVIDHMKNLGG